MSRTSRHTPRYVTVKIEEPKELLTWVLSCYDEETDVREGSDAELLSGMEMRFRVGGGVLVEAINAHTFVTKA